METGLKEQVNNPLSLELNRAKHQIGELSMATELLREKSRKQGPLVLWMCMDCDKFKLFSNLCIINWWRYIHSVIS